MELSQYAEIVKIANLFHDPRKCLSYLATKYPEVKKQTFYSIYDHMCQRRMKQTFRKYNSPEKTHEYYFRYCEDSQHNVCEHVILTMATQEGLPPSLMARMILEKHLSFTKYQGNRAPKGEISDLIKDPWKINDPVLSKEIEMCIYSDIMYGPITDKRKQSVGHEHEAILKRMLNEKKIPFQDESHLVSKGFDKTPDVVLQIPIAVAGNIITWIESKASFGDPETHDGYLRDQYWCYQNRFGPGLVIYWFGYVKEVDVHREDGIILSDSLPEHFEMLEVD